MPKTKISPKEEIDTIVAKLPATQAEVVQALRSIILNTASEIAEQVKWNSPAFYYTGEMKPFDPKEYKRDIVVFNLRNKKYVLLVFPTGAKVNDGTGLLEGNYTDGRKMAKVYDLQDAKAKEDALQKVVRDWLALVEK